MNRIDIQRNAGFPVQKQTFDFLQQAYGSAIEHLCRVYGNNVILYGVELVGGNRTAGAVVINGELLPFEASPNATHIAIVETAEHVQFRGGELLPAYITRVARCATNGAIALAGLRRIRAGQTDWVNCEWEHGDEGGTLPCGDATPWRVIEPIQVRINEAGRVQIRGRFTFGIHGPELILRYLIPERFRPATDKVVALSYADQTTGNTFATPKIITTHGEVLMQLRAIGVQNGQAPINCEYELW